MPRKGNLLYLSERNHEMVQEHYVEMKRREETLQKYWPSTNPNMEKKQAKTNSLYVPNHRCMLSYYRAGKASKAPQQGHTPDRKGNHIRQVTSRVLHMMLKDRFGAQSNSRPKMHAIVGALPFLFSVLKNMHEIYLSHETVRTDQER